MGPLRIGARQVPVAAVATAVVVVVVVVWLVLSMPGTFGTTAANGTTTTSDGTRDANPSPDSTSSAPHDTTGTADPIAFARDVATLLFDWNTASARTLGAHRGDLLVLADPTGVESPGLVSDLDAYVPATATWEQLAEYETRQWIEVTDVSVPAAWPEAVAAAPEGSLAPGTVAVTVDGVRHRAGVWEGDDVASAHPVAFTVFVVCAPSYPACHLLRLSELDNPLR